LHTQSRGHRRAARLEGAAPCVALGRRAFLCEGSTYSNGYLMPRRGSCWLLQCSRLCCVCDPEAAQRATRYRNIRLKFDGFRGPMIFIEQALSTDLAKSTGNPANSRKANNGEVFRSSALEELRLSATSQLLAEVDVKILFKQWRTCRWPVVP
jgi:hypothetical protein